MNLFFFNPVLIVLKYLIPFLQALWTGKGPTKHDCCGGNPAGRRNATVSMYLKNARGKIVWIASEINTSTREGVDVNVSKFPNGIYYLQITGVDKNVNTQKIIVAR